MIISKIDQKDIKQSFCTIKNYGEVKNLEIKNHDLLTDWTKIGEFKNLEYLIVENSLINAGEFYTNLALLKKIKLFSVDESCYFLKNDLLKKSQLKFLTLKKFTYTCSKKDQINFDLDTSNNNHKEGKLNFLSFPNFPSCLPALEEIEIKNYESYLKKKELNYDEEESNEENEIIYKLNFHNFSRIKNLKNIILCKSSEELFKNEKIISKIFQFPNDKKIKINNNYIKDIKTKLASARELYFDFDVSKINYDNFEDGTIISKYNLRPDSIIVNYPAHHYWGYSSRFQKIFDSAEIMIVNCLGQFCEYVSEMDSYAEEFLDIFEKGKSLKKIKIIVKNSKISVFQLELLIKKIRQSKKIVYEFIFEEYINDKEIPLDYENYLTFFYFILYNNKKLSSKFLTNLDNNYLKIFLEKLFFNQIKTILVVEDTSNSKLFKNLNDVEVPIVDWPYIGDQFKTYEFDLGYDSLEKEENFRDFFYEHLSWGHTYLPNNVFLDNINRQAIIVKKDYLDKSKKIVFNELENISFNKMNNLLDIDYENYEDLKKKKFIFPLSINKKKIKRLYIQDNFVFKISDLQDYENLEEFTFSGHLDEDDKNINIFPKMNKLRVLDYSVDYPFIKQADSTFTNFENSTNLEKMTLNLGYKERRDGARWVSNTVDVSKFNNLKKLNFLELNSLEQTNIKNLNNLKHLKTFNLINPCMVTVGMGSDSGTVDEPLNENDFQFLEQSKDLEHLQIYFPRFGEERININFEKFFKYLNLKLKSINLLLALSHKQLSQAHILYNNILKNLKEIEEIRLQISDIGFPELKYNKRKKNGYEVVAQEIEKNAKNPIIIDLETFNDFKNLKLLDFKFSIHIGTKIKNLVTVKTFEKLNINVSEHLLDIKELEKLFYSIASKKDIFMYEHNKGRKKIVEYSWDLNKKNKEEYEKIEKEEEYETKDITINNKPINKILSDRMKN